MVYFETWKLDAIAIAALLVSVVIWLLGGDTRPEVGWFTLGVFVFDCVEIGASMKAIEARERAFNARMRARIARIREGRA